MSELLWLGAIMVAAGVVMVVRGHSIYGQYDESKPRHRYMTEREYQVGGDIFARTGGVLSIFVGTLLLFGGVAFWAYTAAIILVLLLSVALPLTKLVFEPLLGLVRKRSSVE